MITTSNPISIRSIRIGSRKITHVKLNANVLAIVWYYLEVSLQYYPLLFPIFILGSLYVLYRGRESILLVLFAVGSIGLWLECTLAEVWGSTRSLDITPEHVAVTAAAFILLYTFSNWLNRMRSPVARDYGAVLALWSLRFGLVFMVVLSFEEPWKSLIGADWDHRISMFAIVGSLVAGSVYLAHLSSRLRSVIYILPFFVVSLVTVISTDNDVHAVLFQVAYNLALIATGVMLIIKGIHSGVSHYFFLGIATILLVALMRYIDLIGDYVGGAILFMVCAALLLGAARYWKAYLARGEIA